MKLSNFNLFPVTITSTTADVVFNVTHGCTIDEKAVIPRGLIITRRWQAAQLYYDLTTWTSSIAPLYSDTASAGFNVLFIA